MIFVYAFRIYNNVLYIYVMNTKGTGPPTFPWDEHIDFFDIFNLSYFPPLLYIEKLKFLF